MNAIKNTINYTIIIILYDLIEPLIDSNTSKWCIVWYFGFWVISPPPWFGITVTLQFYCSFKIEQKHCILAINSYNVIRKIQWLSQFQSVNIIKYKVFVKFIATADIGPIIKVFGSITEIIHLQLIYKCVCKHSLFLLTCGFGHKFNGLCKAHRFALTNWLIAAGSNWWILYDIFLPKMVVLQWKLGR